MPKIEIHESYNEFVEKYKNEGIEVTNFCVNGKCSNCGNCCSNYLNISNKELKEIKKYCKRHKVKLNEKKEGVTFDFTCPFRDWENGSCKIYPVRPLICRLFQCNQDIKTIKRNKDYVHNNKNYPMRDFRNIFK